MQNNLESATVKQFLKRGLTVLERGLGHAYAATLAVPIGTLQWVETDQTERIRSIQELDLDPRTKEDMIRRRERYQASRPSLLGYIRNWYRDLKPQ